MANKRKCALCGEYIEATDNSMPYKTRYVHTTCFNASMKALASNKQEQLAEKAKSKKRQTVKAPKEIAKPISEEEYKAKQKFYDYMSSVLEVEQLGAKFYTLSARYVEQYNSSWEEMYNIFYWHLDIMQNEPVGDCIGLFPYILDEGRQFYTALKTIEEQNREIQVNNFYHEKVIKINPHKKKNIKQMNIEDIV